MAVATKTPTQVDDWTALVAGAFGKGSEADVSSTLEQALMVTVVHADADANANGVLVKVQARAGENDEDWKNLYPPIRMGAGQAITRTLDAEATSPTAVVPLTDASGTIFEALGTAFFILNGTIVNSEVVTVSAFTTTASVTGTDNLKNTQQNGLSAFTGVAEKFFPIPGSVHPVRVLFFNDDADADMAWRVDLAEMSSIA